MIDLKTDIYYKFVLDSLYDLETLDYNGYVQNEWEIKKKNDEFNLISSCNEKPTYNIYEDDENKENENNPYFVNPYIEYDIYNRNDNILFFIIKQLIKWIDNTNNYNTTEQEKAKFKILVFKLFYYLFLRNKDYLDFEDNDLNNFVSDLTESYKNQYSLYQFINKTIVKAKDSALNFKDTRFQEILKNQKV